MSEKLNGKLWGRDLFGDPMTRAASGPVAERFTFPPFSVLDARSGEWQDRKRAWISMGIKSEIGRGTDIVPNGTARSAKGDGCWVRGFGRSMGQDLMRGENPNFAATAITETTGASIFDPVVCELAYRWFCPPGGQVVDPFAGGSVRGIVAAALGLDYWGCDLRAEQIAANEEQATSIDVSPRPRWVCGDSMETLPAAPDADFLFSCPPYGDLEVYSDDPRDLSTMEWHTFAANYRRIIMRSIGRLKSDRFACFVVGDFRDPRGYYRDFVSETIGAFKEHGCALYNEAVLVTAVGSASIRVGKQFESGRKMCKTHQNVLVFVKGSWEGAVAAIEFANIRNEVLS